MELADVFPLTPDVEKEIRPEALKHYNEWRAEILKDIPELSQMSKEEVEADIQKYLTDTEKASLQKYLKDIAEWLWECTKNQNVPFYISLPIVYLPALESKRLLRQAYERKARETEEKRRIEEAKAAEEQKKKDAQRRAEAAMKALNPPVEKAQRYLDENEFQQFSDSVVETIVASATRGEHYVRDPRALRYFQWVDEISARQIKEEREKGAQEKAKKYNHSLNNEVTRLKAELCKEKQDTESYFNAHVGNRRYLPYTFAFVSSAQEEQKRDAIVKQKVDEIVHPQFSKFISPRHRTSYFLLPFAEFCAEDILLLNFYFKVYAIVEIEVWLEPGQGTIDGYVFTFPWIEHRTDYGTHLTKAQKPELLGCQYLLLTPSDLGHIFWKSLPLVLVKGLMAGELEPEGTSIIELAENLRTYAIKGFDDEVVIPDIFTEYLKELGGIEGMVNAGVISNKVASVIKNRLAQLLTLPTSPSPIDRSAWCFEEEEFISTLTGLGVPRKDAEDLLPLIPRNLLLPEAIRLALQKYKDVMSHKGANGIT